MKPVPRIVTTKDIKDSTIYFQPGDYVVKHYNDLGKPDETVRSGFVPGANELADKYASLSSKVAGVEFIPPTSTLPLRPEKIPAKRGHKKNGTPVKPVKRIQKPTLKPLPEYDTPNVIAEQPSTGLLAEAGLVQNRSTTGVQTEHEPEQLKETFKVNFITGFGKIAMKVLDVYATTIAFGLLFQSADDITFTPKASQTLQLQYDLPGEPPYPEAIDCFYPDVIFDLPNGEKLMLLFKTEKPEV